MASMQEGFYNHLYLHRDGEHIDTSKPLPTHKLRHVWTTKSKTKFNGKIKAGWAHPKAYVIVSSHEWVGLQIIRGDEWLDRFSTGYSNEEYGPDFEPSDFGITEDIEFRTQKALIDHVKTTCEQNTSMELPNTKSIKRWYNGG